MSESLEWRLVVVHVANIPVAPGASIVPGAHRELRKIGLVQGDEFLDAVFEMYDLPRMVERRVEVGGRVAGLIHRHPSRRTFVPGRRISPKPSPSTLGSRMDLRFPRVSKTGGSRFESWRPCNEKSRLAGLFFWDRAAGRCELLRESSTGPEPRQLPEPARARSSDWRKEVITGRNVAASKPRRKDGQENRVRKRPVR
jgi:hypothetical protein